MNYEMLNNNKVYLQGVVDCLPTLSHTLLDEQFYTFNLRVARLSGKDDILPITMPEKLMLTTTIEVGKPLALRGQFRSHNKLEDGRSKLQLSVFCREICEWNSGQNSNIVELNGYICKSPIYRVTPFNREICDILLAVNRSYNKSDYIPCISWGRDAKFAGAMAVGTAVQIVGRIQSREYIKRVDGEEPQTRIAYEVSVSEVTTKTTENAL